MVSPDGTQGRVAWLARLREIRGAPGGGPAWAELGTVAEAREGIDLPSFPLPPEFWVGGGHPAAVPHPAARALHLHTRDDVDGPFVEDSVLGLGGPAGAPDARGVFRDQGRSGYVFHHAAPSNRRPLTLSDVIRVLSARPFNMRCSAPAAVCEAKAELDRRVLASGVLSQAERDGACQVWTLVESCQPHLAVAKGVAELRFPPDGTYDAEVSSSALFFAACALYDRCVQCGWILPPGAAAVSRRHGGGGGCAKTERLCVRV